MMPLNMAFTNGTGSVDLATIGSLKALLDDSANTKTYSAEQLSTGRHWHVVPASNQQFPEWQTFRELAKATVTELELLNHGLLHQGTSTVLIGLHACGTAQDYEVKVLSEDFCRFPGNSLIAQNAQQPPPLQSTEGFAAAAAGLPYS